MFVAFCLENWPRIIKHFPEYCSCESPFIKRSFVLYLLRRLCVCWKRYVPGHALPHCFAVFCLAGSRRSVYVQSTLRRRPGYRTLERDLIQLQQQQLFQIFVVVSLRKGSPGNSYYPEITQQFPKMVRTSIYSKIPCCFSIIWTPICFDPISLVNGICLSFLQKF